MTDSFFIDEGIILPETDSQDFPVVLKNRFEEISYLLNRKIEGTFSSEESLTGQRLVLDSNPPGVIGNEIFRRVIDFGSLPNSSTKKVPHYIAITEDLAITKLYGTATRQGTTGTFAALTFPQKTNVYRVDLEMDGIEVKVVTNYDLSLYLRCFIFIEYVKI
jgi:hypothetical protein